MLNTRIALLPIVVLLVVACGSGSPSTSQIASTPVTTPAAAWAAVVAFEPRFASIEAKDPDLIGQGSWFEIQPASGVGAFVAMVQIGWGDCPAGCIDRHTWTLAIGPDGIVTVIDDQGPVVPVELLPPSQIASGMSVRATAGPICPVDTVPPDPACAPRPVVRATITITDASGATVVQGVTGILGILDITIPAGTYTIVASPVEGYMGTPGPTEATVINGGPTLVEVGYDTGIR